MGVSAGARARENAVSRRNRLERARHVEAGSIGGGRGRGALLARHALRILRCSARRRRILGALEAFALGSVRSSTWLVLDHTASAAWPSVTQSTNRSRHTRGPDTASNLLERSCWRRRTSTTTSSITSQRALLPAARAACAVNVEAGVPRRRPHDTRIGGARGIGGPQTVGAGIIAIKSAPARAHRARSGGNGVR